MHIHWIYTHMHLFFINVSCDLKSHLTWHPRGGKKKSLRRFFFLLSTQVLLWKVRRKKIYPGEKKSDHEWSITQLRSRKRSSWNCAGIRHLVLLCPKNQTKLISYCVHLLPLKVVLSYEELGMSHSFLATSFLSAILTSKVKAIGGMVGSEGLATLQLWPQFYLSI